MLTPWGNVPDPGEQTIDSPAMESRVAIAKAHISKSWTPDLKDPPRQIHALAEAYVYNLFVLALGARKRALQHWPERMKEQWMQTNYRVAVNKTF
jgi:hypothetical protein